MKNLKKIIKAGFIFTAFSLSSISYSNQNNEKTSFWGERDFFNFSRAKEVIDLERSSVFARSGMILRELSNMRRVSYAQLYGYTSQDVSDFCYEFRPVRNHNKVKGFILEEGAYAPHTTRFNFIEFSSVNICDMNEKIPNLDRVEDFARRMNPLLLDLFESMDSVRVDGGDSILFTNTKLEYIEPKKFYAVRCSYGTSKDIATLCPNR